LKGYSVVNLNKKFTNINEQKFCMLLRCLFGGLFCTTVYN